MLKEMFIRRKPITAMCTHLGRTEGAVMAKLEDLGLADNPNRPPWTRRPTIKRTYFVGDNSPSHRQKRKENRAKGIPDRFGFIWSNGEECLLIREFREKMSLEEMCKVHKRGRSGIMSRMKHLELI